MLWHLFKIIILLIFCNISYAKDFGSFVNSYDIAETDALEMIKNKLSKMQESGEIVKLQKKLQFHKLKDV